MIVAKEQPYYQSPPGEKYSPVSRPRPKVRPWERLVLTVLVLLIFALGILISIFYSLILITGYQITRMQKELAELEIQTRGLAEEVSRLSSLERVEAVATTRLGMVKPDERQVVLVQAANGAQDPPPESKPVEKPRADDTGKGRAPKGQHWILQALTDLVIHRSQGHSG